MRRTQIYLTEEQHKALDRMSKVAKVGRSELIRDAIERYLRHPHQFPEWKRGLAAAFGMWKDRPEVVEEIAAARRSLDRDVFAERDRQLTKPE